MKEVIVIARLAAALYTTKPSNSMFVEMYAVEEINAHAFIK